jgi:hypothetical protein
LASLDSATKERLDRARKQRTAYETTWAICDAFYHGRQNVVRSVSDPRRIIELAGRRQQTSGELTYRRVTNRILPTISTLVAKYNSRMPGWSVEPESGDPVAINNARASEHALISEYDRIGLSRKFTDALTLAANQGEAFADVRWDSKYGRAIDDETNEGAVCVRILPPQCVLFEQGLRYEESPWYAIEVGLPPSEVEARYGLKQPKPDGVSAGSLVDNVLAYGERDANMVTVTEFYERPTPKNPQGVYKVIVNDQIVETNPYPYGPLKFGEITGNWLVKYSYFNSPTRDRDMGITEHLIDIQNAWNVTENQIAKIKDLRANRPIISLKGSYTGPANLTPGAKYEYNDPDGKPEFLEIPEVGGDTFNYLELLKANFEAISGANAVTGGQAPGGDVGASGTKALIEQDDSQRAAILKNLAQSHSKLGLEILLLLRAHATEARLMHFTGKSGHDGAMQFRGDSQVPKTLQVRVSPGSIERRSREKVEAMVLAYADRGWIDPRIAMSAIESGTADNILDQFDLDVQWQQREDRRMAGIKDGPELAQALQADADIKAKYEEARLNAEQLMAMGQPVPPVPPPPPSGPWPHAREFDNHKIHMDTMNLYRKTEEFDLLPENVKEVFQRHYEEHESFQAQADQRAYEAQQAQAMEQGQANAARPTRERGVPSAPAPSPHKQGQAQRGPAI